MDITQLAADVAKILAPFLPYLIEGGKIAAKAAIEKAGENFSDAAWNKAQELWGKLKPKVASAPDTQNALERAARKPEDKRIGILELQFEDLFNEDTALAEAVQITIGRDVIDSQVAVGHNNVQIGKVDSLQVFLGSQPAPIKEDSSDEELTHAYLRALASECSALSLGVVDARFLETTHEDSIALSSIYIDLDVQPPLEEGEETKRRSNPEMLMERERENRVPVLQALTDTKLRHLVLLGDPGSGKTTCLHYITYALCLARQNDAAAQNLLPADWTLKEHFPVRLILRNVAAQHIPPNAKKGTAEMIWNALRADFVERLNLDEDIAQKLFSKLQQHILKQPCLIMLDGLDEVPEADNCRSKLVEAIQQFTAPLVKETCVLVTARPYAYADPKWRLPNFKTLTLLPFSSEQIERFITRWYQIMRETMKWDEITANDKAQSLNTALQEKEYLFDLGTRPLLLTLMATLHTSWGKLPDDRADLYDETVRLLLDRWQRWRVTRDADGNEVMEKSISLALSIDENDIRTALYALAYNVHTRQGKDTENRQNAPADIRQEEVLAAFAPHLPDTVHPRVVINYLEDRAGLLLGRGNGVYAFPHRSFQEYLAARYINRYDPINEYVDLLRKDPLWWREVFLFGIGEMSDTLGNAIAVLNNLMLNLPDEKKRGEKDWLALALAGQALTEMKLGADAPRYEKLINAVGNSLAELLQENRLTPRERAEAGNVLAKLGDPRAGVINDFVFCEIPAGTFLMGSKKGEKDSRKEEYPQFEYTIPYNYFISRYPITNAQFDLFVKDENGYCNDEWWTKAGLEWRKDRKEPDKAGGVFDLPNHPVVMVRWYEAQAFTRWLTYQLNAGETQAFVWNKKGKPKLLSLKDQQYEVRLPSEAEWECAARGGTSTRYSWGDEITTDYANYLDTNLNTTSAVGAFPLGMNEYGLLDMSGNVWEWTRSLWGKDYNLDYPYPYKEDDGRENLDADQNVARVLRGGSFDSVGSFLRCAIRYYNNPLDWVNLIGFRVVVCVSSLISP